MSKAEPKTTLSSVAIIVPTCGRPELLKICLRQILPYIEEHTGCVIVVSDDGNADRTRAALGTEFNHVKLVQGPRRGPAANRNRGVEYSTGDLLVFLDDDCRPDTDLIEEYRRAAVRYPECSVFEGRISAEGTWTSFADGAPANETGGQLWSCNFAVRRDLFLSIGGFDDRFPFPTMEDMEFKVRVQKRSRICFLPEARVFHGIQRRTEWRHLRHHALSVILYCHLHGFRETGHSPWRILFSIASILKRDSLRYVRGEVRKDLTHVFSIIWMHVLILIVVLFWGFHPYLARKFFPACCAGCRSIHASLMHDGE